MTTGNKMEVREMVSGGEERNLLKSQVKEVPYFE